MKNTLKKIYAILRLAGLDPIRFLRYLKGIGYYFKDLHEIKKQKGADKSFVFGEKYPILDEMFVESGTMSGHYFHQDLFVARLIFEKNPPRHIDIGSRIDGFVAHVAVFREIEIFDFRPQFSKVKNIKFTQADLMKLPLNLKNSCDSISSLHAIEHFGLGRYGDPVDYNGHLKAIQNIYEMLKIGGLFYFSVPIGKQRICFNAHRVFSIKYLLSVFENKFDIVSFSYVDEGDVFHEKVTLNDIDVENNFDCSYGCGIFELIKI